MLAVIQMKDNWKGSSWCSGRREDIIKYRDKEY